jgi:hypothetical protein
MMGPRQQGRSKLFYTEPGRVDILISTILQHGRITVDFGK